MVRPLHSCFHHVWSAQTVRTYAYGPGRRKGKGGEKKNKKRRNRLWPRCGARGGESAPLTRLSITCASGGSCAKRLLRIQPHQSSLVRERAGVAITFRIIRRELLPVSAWFRSPSLSQPIYVHAKHTHRAWKTLKKVTALSTSLMFLSDLFFCVCGERTCGNGEGVYSYRKTK